tara:strand:- start:293 stop:652 length:360 start_codon:yes stop_codon:yes gene_type:complete
LFFAFTSVDNNVREEEVKAVQQLVRKYWLDENIINTISKRDAEDAILKTFDWLCKDNDYNAEACYDSFVSFKKQNESFFTDSINSLILKTVGKIAASFSGQNKSELILLAKLNIELKKD